jgi:hypothetical protein
MTSIIAKTAPIVVALTLLAGSPAFAAKHDLNGETARAELQPAATTFRHQSAVSSFRNDNASPYFGLWLEGYPRSSAR